MTKRYTQPHLIALALQYAIEEREYFMECVRGSDPEPYARAAELVKAWKAILAKKYHQRSYGEVLDEEMAKAGSVSINTLMAAPPRKFALKGPIP